MRARGAIAAALIAGCAGSNGPPPVARIEVHAVPTIVDQCDGTLAAWAVKVEETGERQAAACEQTIVLSDLVPYERYTLDVTGDSSKAQCWSGKCVVTALVGLGVADCPHAAAYECADAGGIDAGGP